MTTHHAPIKIIVLVAMATLGCSPLCGGESWPLFRGNALSTGVSQDKLPEQLKVLWKFKVKNGAFEGTAAIANGVAYLGDLDGKVYALDLKTGEKKWEFASQDQDGFIASPAIRGDKLYIGDTFGRFYCLDTKTGKAVWGFETEGEIDASANFYEGHVLVGSQDATLYCLTADKGEVVWKFEIADQIRCSPTVVENRCFLAGCDGKLHIVDLKQGKEVAAVEIDGPTMSTPAVIRDKAYFGTEGGTFFCIDWKQAATVWTYQHARGNRSIRSSAAATDKHIVYGDQNRRVIGLDAEGQEKWTFTTKGRVDSSPVIVGTRAFVGSADGRVYGIDITTGKKVWEYEAGGGFASSPAVAEGKLVIASDDGVVYCFGTSK